MQTCTVPTMLFLWLTIYPNLQKLLNLLSIGTFSTLCNNMDLQLNPSKAPTYSMPRRLLTLYTHTCQAHGLP